ncbi:glycosyltransferase family 4 protein [Flavobacteriales bacterium]|nr:glycosyltransferase family 4 protein [Flavobacteriales bacterium]
MRILVSAYACEPNKGSEPEVGWRWMIKLSEEYDELVIVTRANNQENVEAEFSKLNIKNVTFKYFDLPKWATFWKKGGTGVNLYSYLWEALLFFYLLKRYKRNHFDIAQRVTFVAYKFPSFIWYFAKKFTFGPIAGGERYPLSFLRVFSFKGKIKEITRMLLQRLSLLDPFILLTFHKASKIIAVTDDTKSILPRFARIKTIVEPAISIDVNDFDVNNTERSKRVKENPIRLLYVGNLLELKGIKLILMALKDIKRTEYDFNIVGSGPDEKRLKAYVQKNNLNVNFLGQKKRNELSEYYLSHDIFVFPSLHDSGGMVVLEAKAHGLPVVVSSFGGPKMFVNETDTIIKARYLEEFIEELRNSIFSSL